MLILFLCQWKFMVMESDWFNANESHVTARCLPFVLKSDLELCLLLSRCFASPPVFQLQKTHFIAKLNWYGCLINCKNLDKFFPSLLLFHNPIQNHIPEGETACPHQLSQPFVKQDFFCSRLCRLSRGKNVNGV